MHLVLHTPHLTLRPLRTDDAHALNRIANEAHILKWMPDWRSSPEDTLRLIEHIAPHFPEATKEKACVIFGVFLDGVFIGIAGIGNKEEVDNEIETAFFISEEYSGNGYSTEAVRAVSHWALSTLQLPYLMAIVEPGNAPSQRVVEKCGFQKLGVRMILNSGETEEKPFYYYRLYSA